MCCFPVSSFYTRNATSERVIKDTANNMVKSAMHNLKTKNQPLNENDFENLNKLRQTEAALRRCSST